MALLRSLFDLIHAGWVLAREGVISELPQDGLPPMGQFAHRIARLVSRRQAKDRQQSERLSIALNRLGPSWVKLGQFLATRPDVVGTATAKDLELLHDRVAPFPTADAKRRIEESLGRKTDEIFSQFSEPIAAASIAQVHKATLKASGKQVAVKVIRPDIRRRFGRDLDTFYAAAGLAERFLPDSRRLKPNSIVDTLRQSARIEMDLRLEAAAFSEMADNIENDEGFRVPMIDWELTGRDCITMDWVDGIKLTEVDQLQDAGYDLEAIAAQLIQSFLTHAVGYGFFHADMHPGNLFVEPGGTIVAVDMGISGRLNRKERRFLAEILYGFIRRDYMRVSEVHFEAGYVPGHHDVASFAQAIRAIGEPIHGQSAETISMAKLLTLLFEVTDLFDMQTRPELIMLQKTMVVVEGVARTLDPKFNMWKTAEPVIGAWIARNLGPRRIIDDAQEAFGAARRLGELLPEMVEGAEALQAEMKRAADHGFRLDAETTERIGKAEARNNRWGHAALWVLAAVAVYWTLTG